MAVEILQFGNKFEPIEIKYENVLSYRKCRKYDPRMLAVGYKWHQIVVYHCGQFKHMANPKQLILDAIFEAIDNVEFYPVAYRSGTLEDKFLVRNCKDAFDKLFDKNLSIVVIGNLFVELCIQFNVANYVFKQVSPQTLLARTVGNLMDSMERYGNHCGILNLKNFADNSNFEHIVLNLGNTTALKHVCEHIYRNDDNFRSLNGLILSGNNIRTVAPLQILKEVEFVLLDLSDNCLASTTHFCRDIQNIRAADLFLAGNPLVKSSKYPECLKPLEKNFKFIDGEPFDRVLHTQVPKEYVKMEKNRQTNRIDAKNIDDIVNYVNSTNWHAVLVPDPTHKYPKETLFDFFFLSVSTELCEFYPCYYRYENGEHRFLVRNCYDQLEHLAMNCGLEISLPNLIDADSGNIEFKETLPYYLLMDISEYKPNQILPINCIDVALSRRFSALDRLLNLERFQETEGLEDIIVNLSNSKILFSVLSIASRKFLCNCTELRLAQNKILGLKSIRSLTFLTNIQAIDLGNNWITDLCEIQDLGMLPLKALRLDGNPLCGKYTLPSEYVKAVREIFPFLVKLDNVDLTSNPALKTHKNYLVDLRGYELVEQFVAHFFRAFESDERVCMAGLYESMSLFTMTCNYMATEMTVKKHKRLSKYQMHAKNNLKLSEPSRAPNGFHVGPEEIINVFMQLPAMKFDFTSFNIDAVHHDYHSTTIIYVSGVFNDVAVPNDEMIFAFTMRFIIKLTETNVGLLNGGERYKIINQTFNVVNATETQRKHAFKIERSDELQEKRQELSIAEKERMLIIFHQLTGATPMWCSRCLTEAKWDMKVALDEFIELNKHDKIQFTGFI